MAQPVTVYRWDDVGAPQIDVMSPSRIINVLKKCLVDGYGAKSPLGWTLEFEDTVAVEAVFRNSTTNGSGGYLKVSPYTNDAGPHFVIQSAASVLSINDLLYPGYKCSVGCHADDKRWIIIGTDTAFYLVLHHNTQNYNLNTINERSFFAGDFISSFPNDPGRFVVLGYSGGGSATTAPVVSGGSFNQQVPFNYSASTATQLTSAFSGGAAVLVQFGTDGSASNISYIGYVPDERASAFGAGSPVNYESSTILMPFYLKRTVTSPTVAEISDPITPFVRGLLPGIYSGMLPAGSSETFPNIFSFDGVSHLGLANDINSSSGRGCLRWINLVEW